MFDRLYEGLAWVLASLYDLTHSYGLAVILLTLAVMIIVTPLTIKSTRSMMAMQKYQPEIRRLQAEHKGDRQKLNEELLVFYRQNNINPMGSCLPMLIQMPVFIILYRVVGGITRLGEDGTFDPRYVSHNSEIYQSLQGSKQMLFLGIDLAKSAAKTLSERGLLPALPYLLIIAVVTVSSYIQQRQVAGRNPDVNMNPMQKNLMRIMPLSFGVFSFSFPAALGLYFVTSNLFRVGQQAYISRALYGVKNGSTADESGTNGVIDVDLAKGSGSKTNPKGDTSKPAKPGSARDGSKPSKPDARPEPRPPSGRVTQPKRPPGGANKPNTSAPERRRGIDRTGRSGGAMANGDAPRASRRRPFGPDNSSNADPDSASDN